MTTSIDFHVVLAICCSSHLLDSLEEQDAGLLPHTILHHHTVDDDITTFFMVFSRFIFTEVRK